MKNFITTIWSSYQKHRGIITPISFGVGFVMDSLSTKRIDVMKDNYKLLVFLVLAGLFIILFHLVEQQRIKAGLLVKYQNLIPAGIQFFLGALYSNHVYFYFQSSAGLKSFIFITLLLALLLTNEFYKNKWSSLYLQFGMYFLAAFSFFVFFMPLFTKTMNRDTFLLAGALSVIFTLSFLMIVLLIIRKGTRILVIKTAAIIVISYGLLNAFYFLHWIPPVPLALRYSGIYHHMAKRGFQYELQYEKPSGLEFWRKSNKVFKWMPGDTVHCFAAIFAPTEMNKTIHYLWEQYIPEKKNWVLQDDQSHVLQGGREGGYRGFSRKTIITPGEWRIEIKTEENELLGSLEFEVQRVQNDYERNLETILR